MTTNNEAANETVEALRLTGRLESIDASLVAGFLSIATALDEDPSNAALWREYRAFDERLRATGGAGADDDDLIARMSAAMGNAPKT